MAFIIDAALDALLNYIDTNGANLYITDSEATSYADATTAPGTGSMLGSKTGITISAPSDRTGGGRKITISAITDGSVSTSGTATHWAITNGSDTLIATGPLSASASVTSGNAFTLTAFDIGVPDAA